jgi:hypothetical protein
MNTRIQKQITEADLAEVTQEIELFTWTNKRLTVRPNHKFKYLVYKGDEVHFCGNFLDVATNAYNEL